MESIQSQLKDMLSEEDNLNGENNHKSAKVTYTEDITRWIEDMKFIFEWKKYFTSECSEQIKSFFHEKINFTCSNQHLILYIDMSVLKIKKKNRRKTKEKQGNDVSDIFTSDVVLYGKYELSIFLVKKFISM